MTQSHDLFVQAQRHIPGGVNSPVRAFRGVGGDPLFFARGEGAYLYDEDGKRYVDYVGSWGPMIAGHAHPEVLHAVREAIARGLGFGAPTKIETQMADRVCELVPSMDMVRMVSSGTEATMSAIRLARGYTGRDKILKFEGCYHGHSDSLLVKAGSGALTLGVPTSPGVPAVLAEHTLTVAYNNLEQVREIFAQYGRQIACIIVEPVAGNMNCIPPTPGFLHGLRAVCDEFGSVLIFDEVMTGFRVALGGAQALFKVQPDLTTLGKVIGGGFRSAPSAASAPSWKKSRRWARCIRPAPCRAIRCRWRRGWQCWALFPNPASSKNSRPARNSSPTAWLLRQNKPKFRSPPIRLAACSAYFSRPKRK